MAHEPDGEQGDDRDVWSVCGQLKHLSTGERAALRRMPLTRSPAADGIVEKLLRRAGVFVDAEDNATFEMWRLLAHAAAVIAGTSGRMAHAGKRPLGRALHEAGLKTTTINRLLTARGSALPDQVRRVALRLADSNDAVPANLAELRDLASPHVASADQARRSVARAYFAAEDRKDREKTQ
jgi:hypothetical protein